MYVNVSKYKKLDLGLLKGNRRIGALRMEWTLSWGSGMLLIKEGIALIV